MTQGKLEHLRDIIGGLDAAIVAYSGGADSAFLADVAHEVLGDRAVAVTAVSPSLAPEEREAAGRIARQRGWRHEEVATLEIDRDDSSDLRPGQKAAREQGVRAPLLEAELTKEEIRSLSRERGLPTWNKPASACLASRIAYGVEVTRERLDRVARAESFLRSLGLDQLRVRDHGDLARVEVPVTEVPRVASDQLRSAVADFLRGLGFAYVTLDLEGFRSGSMNAVLLDIGRRGA